MSDAPLQGAPTNGATGLPRKVDPRDVADIDRELEAYLKEKQIARPIGLGASVDEQLTRVKEKASNRFTEKTPPAKNNSLPPKATEQTPKTTSRPMSQPTKSTSHEDLIRSLEEKYSAGKEALSQDKKEVSENDNKAHTDPRGGVTPPPSETQKREAKQPEAKENAKSDTASVGAKERYQNAGPAPRKESLLADLKESIEPKNAEEVASLLQAAESLSVEEQESMIKAFLPRFRRNKERKELFLRTQADLEQELRSFINNRVSEKPSKASESSVSGPAVKQKESAPDVAAPPSTEYREPAHNEQSKSLAQGSESPTGQSKQFDILEEQRRTAENTHKVVEEFKSTKVYDPFLQHEKNDEKSEEVKQEEKTAPAPTPVPEETKKNAVEVPQVAKEKETINEATNDQKESTPREAESSSGGEGDIIERYKHHLETTERKPTVLLYDPEQGFVRKAVNPRDSSLNMTYSLDNSAQVVVLQVFDANGAMLSEIRTPFSEF